MRYKPGHKEEARARLLSAVGRGFRRSGFAAIGVDGLAKEAGMTSGAFYAHFGSKDAAFVAALHAGLDEVDVGVPAFQASHGAGWLDAFAAYYLGAAHRADIACGCAMTTLSPEVMRAGPEVKAAYEARMARIAERMADGIAGADLPERRARAWEALSLLIGGLILARSVGESPAADAIAAAVRAAVAAIPAARVDADASPA